MTLAQWPASLPAAYLVAGYREQAGTNALRTQMDAGPAKTRRRFTAGVRTLQVRWQMTTRQKGTVDAFYHDTLEGGALAFRYRRADQDAETGLTGFGSCLEFSGRAQYVRVPSHASLSPGNVFTIEFWLRADDPEGEVGVLHKSAPGSYEYAIEKPAGDRILVFRAYSLTGANAYYATCEIPDAAWHHYAFACDGSESRIYRDADLMQVAPRLAGSMSAGPAPLELGRSTYYGTEGRLDEVRIWSVARTQAEIADNFTRELTGNEPGLAACWRMNEGEGITVADSQSSDNNPGVLIGGHWVPRIETMRFVSAPTYAPVTSEWWSVDAELEVLP